MIESTTTTAPSAQLLKEEITPRVKYPGKTPEQIEKIKAKGRAYYEKNRERCLNNAKQWQASNPDYAKNYYRQNQERCLASAKAWNERNPEKVKAYRPRYRKGAEFKAKPIPELSEADKARFFAKVTPDGECSIWTGVKDKKGYGGFCLRGKEYPAHRVAFLLHNGSINDGLLVIHSCDRPSCVSGAHLSQGTYKDNNTDRMARGRHVPRRRVIQ